MKKSHTCFIYSRTDFENEFTPPSDAKPREIYRLRKLFSRKVKFRGKFLKKAKKFMNQFETFEDVIKQVICNNDVQEIVLSFGISCGCPKEVYLIRIPQHYCDEDLLAKGGKQRGVLQLFRAVVSTVFEL